MAKISKLINEASEAILSGQSDDAQKVIEKAAKMIEERPELLEADVRSSLQRLSVLTKSALAGVADASNLVSAAVRDATEITTYDGRGKSQKVTIGRNAPNRF